MEAQGDEPVSPRGRVASLPPAEVQASFRSVRRSGAWAFMQTSPVFAKTAGVREGEPQVVLVVIEPNARDIHMTVTSPQVQAVH